MARWQYAVAHVEDGEVIEYGECDDYKSAKEEALDCGPDDTGMFCYVVRRPTDFSWRRVPPKTGKRIEVKK